MMWKKLSILLILMIVSSFTQAKDECPLQCDCTEDFSLVKCRDMEKFPVFGFASKVKTLDLTYGNIKTIHENDVKEYKNLEKLFISHNPLVCDHGTIRTLNHVLRENFKLKSFDGHKIKCPRMMPIMKGPRAMAESNHVYHGMLGAGPNVHFHGVQSHSCFSAEMLAGVVCLTILGVIAVVGLCWVIVLFIVTRKKISDAEETVIKMEEGILTTAGDDSDTTDRMLMEGLKKQRRGSQGYPENAFVDSDDDVVEQEDYLRGKMKKQRSVSQGYADGSGSSDEESTMVEINLND